MKKIIQFLFITLLLSGLVSNDKYDPIEKTLNLENAEDLIKRLNDPLTMTVNDYNRVYTKDQASSILRKFFATNPVTEYKVEAKGNNESNSYFNITYVSGRNTFKLYILFRVENGKSTIREVKISKQ